MENKEEEVEISLDKKTEIVFRMMKIWAPRSSETMAQVFPKCDWPESLRNCNLQEFLTTVFNDNPKAITDRGIPSAEAYVGEVNKLL
jgi:hypothetical protein